MFFRLISFILMRRLFITCTDWEYKVDSLDIMFSRKKTSRTVDYANLTLREWPRDAVLYYCKPYSLILKHTSVTLENLKHKRLKSTGLLFAIWSRNGHTKVICKHTRFYLLGTVNYFLFLFSFYKQQHASKVEKECIIKAFIFLPDQWYK